MSFTVIPSDAQTLDETPLTQETFRNALACVQICATAPSPLPMMAPATAPKTIDAPAMLAGITGGTTTTPLHNQIYEFMAQHPTVASFQIDDAKFYVAALQAMMLWFLHHEQETLFSNRCPPVIFLVDEDFAFPSGWQYRYFWKKQASVEHGGLSILHVGLVAREIAKYCQITIR